MATIANVYASVACPASLEATAHDTATNAEPATKAAAAQ
jgi:hypothetical protein